MYLTKWLKTAHVQATLMYSLYWCKGFPFRFFSDGRQTNLTDLPPLQVFLSTWLKTAHTQAMLLTACIGAHSFLLDFFCDGRQTHLTDLPPLQVYLSTWLKTSHTEATLMYLYWQCMLRICHRKSTSYRAVSVEMVFPYHENMPI